MKIIDTVTHKTITSKNYNMTFNKKTGYSISFGPTPDEDPVSECPVGPVLADIELSSAADDDIDNVTPMHVIDNKGCCGKFCKRFCYKQSKSNKTMYMSIDLLKKILDKFPKSLCQIAYGICSVNHPIVFQALEETRKRDIVPNLTISGDDNITNEVALKLSKLCGAIAISVNTENKDNAYNIIKLFSQDFGMSQINIHVVVAEETADFVKSVCDDMKNDNRLSKCNCVVLLSFKNKANVKSFSSVTQETYTDIISYYLDNNCSVGADSCAGCAFQKAIANRKNKNELEQCITNCEATLESVYLNVFGKVFACSFLENRGMWLDGIDILKYNNFMDVWNHPQVQKWRQTLLATKRGCPEYKIGV